MNFVKPFTLIRLLKINHFSTNCHRILGVEHNANLPQIKEAYYNLCKIHHPDHNNGKHTEKYIQIQNAYTELITTFPHTSSPTASLDDILNKIQGIKCTTPPTNNKKVEKIILFNKAGFNHIDLAILKLKYSKLKRPKKRIVSTNYITLNVTPTQEITHTEQPEIFHNKYFERIYYSIIKGISLLVFSSFSIIIIPLEFSIPLNLYIFYLVFKF
jgi:hypothetical protein